MSIVHKEASHEDDTRNGYVLELKIVLSSFAEERRTGFWVREQQPVHGVEKAIWEQMLLLGHKLLG